MKMQLKIYVACTKKLTVYDRMFIRSFFALLFISCNQFKIEEKIDPNLEIEQQWQEIDKNEVEEPPLFSNCQQENREDLIHCFENTVTDHIYKELKIKTENLSIPEADTLWIPVIIEKGGTIKTEEFEIPQNIIVQIPEIKLWIQESFKTLPKVKPAHTRGVPVSVKYLLPLIFESKKS